MKTKKKRMRDRPPNCARCAKRSICTTICEKMEQYMHDVIPSDFGREYPIGSPEFINIGLPRGGRYDLFKVRRLNDKEKKALALRFVNVPNKEIAKILGIPQGYIRHLIYIARQKLRQNPTISDNGREIVFDDSWTKTHPGRRKSPKS